MKLKVSAILNVVPALAEIMSAKLPMSLAIQLVTISEQVDKVVNEFDKRKKALFDEYGDTNDQGHIEIKDKADIDNVNETLNGYVGEDIDLDITKIKKADLNSVDSIEPAVLKGIWFLVE